MGYDDHSIVTLATWLSGRSACLLCCCFAGGVGYDDPIFVEYDLDSEDEVWLAAYNGSEVRCAAHAVHAALSRACCFVPWYSLLAACYFKLKARAWEHSGGTASSCCTQLPQLACCCSVHQPACIHRPLLPICLLQPERLSAEKFEMMLWRLEVTNAGKSSVYCKPAGCPQQPGWCTAPQPASQLAACLAHYLACDPFAAAQSHRVLGDPLLTLLPSLVHPQLPLTVC